MYVNNLNFSIGLYWNNIAIYSDIVYVEKLYMKNQKFQKKD